MNNVKSVNKSLTLTASLIVFLGSFSLFASNTLTQGLKDSVQKIVKSSTEQIKDLSSLVKENRSQLSDIIAFYIKEAGIKNSQISNLIAQIANNAGISNSEAVEVADSVTKSLGLSSSQSESIINLVRINNNSSTLSIAGQKTTNAVLGYKGENSASNFMKEAKTKEAALAVADEIEQKELLRRRRRVSEPR